MDIYNAILSILQTIHNSNVWDEEVLSVINASNAKGDETIKWNKSNTTKSFVVCIRKLNREMLAMHGIRLPKLASAHTESRLSHKFIKSIRKKQFNLIQNITAIKLEMEILTLQPEGRKIIMDAVHNDTKPVFTIECQLSQELIKSISRLEMYNIMQFESDKRKNSAQCFGMQDQRMIKIEPTYDMQHGLNFGRIHFCIWWRKPNTCLNEILGMGQLEIEELLNVPLMEKRKCVAIMRRGKHLANIYFKISLLENKLDQYGRLQDNIENLAIDSYVEIQSKNSQDKYNNSVDKKVKICQPINVGIMDINSTREYLVHRF